MHTAVPQQLKRDYSKHRGKSMQSQGTREPFLSWFLHLHKLEMLWQCNTETTRLYPGKLFLQHLSQAVLHGVNLEFQLVYTICYQLRPSHFLKPKLPLAWLFAGTIWRWKQFVNIIWFNMVTNDFQKKVWIGFVRLIISKAWLRRGMAISACLINAGLQNLSRSLAFPG